MPLVKLTVDRYVDYQEQIRFVGVDWGSDDFTMQIREDWNGGYLVHSMNSTDEGGGISVSSDSEATTVNLRIIQEILRDFPYDVKISDPKILVYDLVKAEDSTGDEVVCLRGEMEIRPGSTQ
mgnify:CR=1 FL=1